MRKDTVYKSPRRFALVFLYLLISVVFLGFSYFAHYQYEKQFRVEIENKISTITDSKISRIRKWRTERIADIQTLTRNALFCSLFQQFCDNPQNPDIKKSLQSWLSLYVDAYGYQNAFLFNAHAEQLLAASEENPGVCPEIQWITPAIFRSMQPEFIDLQFCGSGREIHFFLVAPVFQKGHPLAIIVFDIDPSKELYPLIKAWPTPSKTAETLIVRKDGNDVLFLNDLRFDSEAALKLRIPLSRTEVPAVRAVLGQQGFFEGLDYRNVPVVADVRPLPDLPWSMVTRMDLSEVYAPMRDRTRESILSITVILLVLGAAFIFLWRKMRLHSFRDRVHRQAFFSEKMVQMLEANVSQEQDFITVMSAITTLSSRTLGVQRASIWRYSDDYERIICLDLYDAQQESHEQGQVLKSIDFAEYAAAHECGQVIAAEDVFLDPRTCSIPALYFESAGISSLLDAPVWRQGRLVAVVSFEHVGKQRTWDPEEEQFAQTIAAHVANCMEQYARWQIEEKLKFRNKELAQFSAAVSHDLRSPLVTIQTFVEYLEKDIEKQDSSRVNKDLIYIRAAAGKMGKMLEELHALIRGGRFCNTEVSTELQVIAREALDAVSGAVVSRGVTVMVTEDSLPLCGDRSRLVQLFQNLIDNAVKFMGDQDSPKIEIGFETVDDEVELFVRDNGIGIDPRFQGRIFNLFEKIDSEAVGMGMGLALVKRIVTAHGGTIRVESEGQGMGTCFRFTLPGPVPGHH